MLSFVHEEVEALHVAARTLDVETCAVGFVAPAGQRGDVDRYVVRNLSAVPDAAYTKRTSTCAELAPWYCMEVANAARAHGLGLLFAHTHPGGSAQPGFSSIDAQGEVLLADYLRRRMPKASHYAAVLTGDTLFARRLGCAGSEPTSLIGRRSIWSPTIGQSVAVKYDRQVQAFGLEGQSALQNMVVAIVGLGGTGSVVAQQLAHLGVRAFILVDPDVVEDTNLNRLVGAMPSDVGVSKTAVAARRIEEINPGAECNAIHGDVVDDEVAVRIRDADFIFCCTDSIASRAVLNQLAYQYLIPCIDVGVAIGVADKRVRSITGRTQMLAPGLACLACMDLLDSEQVRREMLSEEERRRDPYIVGEAVPQPAVISLNSTMSSAAVTMFLAAVTGVPSESRMVVYDGIRGAMRPTVATPQSGCIVCSCEGALGRGATWSLPTRKKVAS